MKDFKSALASFIEVVTFLLAAFGGFLKEIAPPNQVGASFPVGIVSFLMLIILMTFSALSRNTPTGKTRKRWIAAGIFFFVLALPASFLYPNALSKYTFPPQAKLSEKKICAPDAYLTADARDFEKANPTSTRPEDLLKNLPDNDIWTAPGIERSEQILLATYALLVLTLSGAIFCLLEATIGNKSSATAAPAPAAPPAPPAAP
jgi:hypothetical protein